MSIPRYKPKVFADNNRIIVDGLSHPKDVSSFYWVAKDLIERKGYSDIYVDFSNSGAIFPNAATPISAAIEFYKAKGVNVVIKDVATFVAASHLHEPISVDSCEPHHFRNPLSKVWKFSDSQGIHNLTERLTESVFSGLACEKGVVESFEWCINEIMDNVLQHAESSCGYVMGQLHRLNGKVAVCIADSGIGLYKSLQSYAKPPLSHVDALTLAIKEGVTRDKRIGQGNGMWGLSSIVSNNDGMLRITSGPASLFYKDSDVRCFKGLPRLSFESPGTVVDFQLNTNKAIDISRALKYEHVNLRLENFESLGGGYKVLVTEHSQGTGTRKSAEMIRNKVANIISESGGVIEIDFSGVGMVSSSFADEFIAKLMLSTGILNFNKIVKISGMNASISGIVEKAIGQRMAQAYSAAGD